VYLLTVDNCLLRIDRYDDLTPSRDPGFSAMLTAEVLVVGAGLAGLRVATELGRRGHDVVLVDRRPRPGCAIRTTGILVRKTLDDYPLPEDCLGPGIRTVVLYPPSLRAPVTLTSDRVEYRVADMARLYEAAVDEARAAGVRIHFGTRYRGRDGKRLLLDTSRGTTVLRATYLVGADGARSRVARDLGLDRNSRLLVGAEETFGIEGGDGPPTFHCVIDPRVAPGYLAWTVNDGRHAHVGVAGHPDRFAKGLKRAVREFRATAPGLAGTVRTTEPELRGGPIPVGGVLRRIGSPAGLLVGDAAGAVSPLTAGGLDPCLRLSDHAAQVLHEALVTGRPSALRDYRGDGLRAQFRGRLLLRTGLEQVRSAPVATAAFAALRTRAGRRAARAVLFRDRSFPDPA